MTLGGGRMHTDGVTRHLTIPNQLTILRILLVPVIGRSWQSISPTLPDRRLRVCHGSGDGHARRTDRPEPQPRHRAGKFLDPWRTSCWSSRCSSSSPVSRCSPHGWWSLSRRAIPDHRSALGGGRSGVVVSSTQLGKGKAFSQNCMILLIILAQPYPWLELPAVVFTWIAVIATIASGLDYSGATAVSSSSRGRRQSSSSTQSRVRCTAFFHLR